MSVGCIKRLQTELKNFKCNPSINVDACPSEDDILKWYFIIDGPRDSPYEGGEYQGYITFPKDYPFKAPHIAMSTPNGRFETNANICMSMTAWHPESWQPSWQTATILQGLASFMAEESSAVATIKKSKKEREELAKKSREWNLKNFKQFQSLFPERYARSKKYVENGGKVDKEEEAAAKKEQQQFYTDETAAKNPVVAEAIRKANEAQKEKERQEAAKKQAATAEKESGQRRDREGTSSASSTIPSNSASSSQQQKKQQKEVEVIEL